MSLTQGPPRPLWQGEPCLWPGTEPSELQADPDAKLNFKKDIFKTLEYSQVLFACPLPLLVPSGRSQEQSVETRDRTWLRPAPSAGTRPQPGAGSTRSFPADTTSLLGAVPATGESRIYIPYARTAEQRSPWLPAEEPGEEPHATARGPRPSPVQRGQPAITCLERGSGFWKHRKQP